jgi:hypothetical protein
VAILGSGGIGGSGKTNVVRRLAALPWVPVTHVDGAYYDAWRLAPAERFGGRRAAATQRSAPA